MDYFMMTHGIAAMNKCDKMLTMTHSDWSKKLRLSRRLCLDYSSPKDWNEEHLRLNNVDIKALWKSGHMKAFAKALESGLIDSSDSVDSLVLLGCTLKKPCGKLIGVKETHEDASTIRESAVIQPTLDDEDEAEPVIPLTDLINCPTIEVDGKNIYKATVINQKIG